MIKRLKKRTDYPYKYTLTEKVFLWPGEQGNWHFVPVSKSVSQEIKANFGKYAKGFRSIPVTVTVGKTVWDTSIFPDSHSGMYILPLKAKVRKAEAIYVDDKVKFTVKIRL